MKQTNTPLLLSLALLLSLSQCRCKDEKKPCQDPTNINCENYDPCYGKIVTVDFTIRQWDGWYIDPQAMLPEDCDTILLHGIRLHPKINVPTNVFWKIGTDDRIFTEGELKMLFSEYIDNPGNLDPNNPNYYKPIPITLTVKTPGWQKCVAPKDTVLQHTRNLVFVRKGYAWYGKFKGVCDFDGQERVVEIVPYFKNNDSTLGNSRVGFINFPNLENLDTIEMSFFGEVKLQSFKQYIWDIGNDDYYYSPEPPDHYPMKGLNSGKVYYDIVSGSKEILLFNYKYVTKDKQVKLYKFKGERIQ